MFLGHHDIAFEKMHSDEQYLTTIKLNYIVEWENLTQSIVGIYS